MRLLASELSCVCSRMFMVSVSSMMQKYGTWLSNLLLHAVLDNLGSITDNNNNKNKRGLCYYSVSSQMRTARPPGKCS